MFDVVIAGNGKGVRSGTDKLTARHGESTVLTRTIEAFSGVEGIARIILVSDVPYDLPGVIVTKGGSTRAASVKNGLAKCTSEFVMIHDGARPFLTRDLIERIMRETERFSSAVPCLPVVDSLRQTTPEGCVAVDRKAYFTVQTPQGYRRKDVTYAYAKATETDLFYDESELYEKYVAPVHYIPGERQNKKITYPDDLVGYNVRVGTGFDVHAFADNGKKLVLGGVCIPYEKGLDAHSDGDVVTHAVMDALLSSADERDIGVLFPDDDPAYENADSMELLATVRDILRRKNVNVNNVSVTIIAQAPKLKDHLPAMQAKLADVLALSPSQINLNATTTERLGIVGEKKAIAVLAIASVF